MSSANPTPARRVRVEQGIYRRRDGLLEIGWRDASGKQKWRGPFKGLKAARAALATEHAHRARGEKVADGGARPRVGGHRLRAPDDPLHVSAWPRDGKRRLLKTKRSRRVLEVTPALIAELRRAKLASARSGDQDFVFLSRAGTPHDHRNVGGRILARAVMRAGLEAVERDGVIVLPAPTFHDLRHSHASALIAQGWDVAEVSARLGHSSVATTLRIYAHQFDAANRSADRRARLAALYGAKSNAASEAV